MMQDQRTRKLKTRTQELDRDALFERSEVKVVAMNGPLAGTEYEVERDRVTLGRGPGVDLAFDDSAMSRQHAAIELVGDAFRIQDLGSTNGVRVNGNRVTAHALRHGDRLELGTQLFQFLVEEREDEPNTYELTPES